MHGFTFSARLPTSIPGLYQATTNGRRGIRALGSRAGLHNYLNEKKVKHDNGKCDENIFINTIFFFVTWQSSTGYSTLTGFFTNDLQGGHVYGDVLFHLKIWDYISKR